MKITKGIFLLICLYILSVSCDGLKKAKNIFETSERAKYERNFSETDSLMVQWKSNFSSAVNNQLSVKDGYNSSVLINSTEIPALGYSIDLKRGDLLVVEITSDSLKSKIFVDIINKNQNNNNHESKLLSGNQFTKVIEESGLYKVILQPEIGYKGWFYFSIFTRPSVGFPVAGKGNNDVQSFWGASRDGGGRSHEGIDIFAKKGTPVVAVSRGSVSRTGNQGLGGKQVWLRDSEFNQSYYYAHLDSIIAVDGQNVKIGDTLGLVGNTGNAAGGAHHLHFGIYTSGGAVDPYPYVKKRTSPKAVNLPSKNVFSFNNIKAGSNLRSETNPESAVLRKITDKTSIKVIAANKNWCHIKTNDGLEGFLAIERLSR